MNDLAASDEPEVIDPEQLPAGPPPGIEEYDWGNLCGMIAKDRCVPIIGGLAREPVVPNASRIAKDWAGAVKFPLTTVDNLADVAQYLEVLHDGHAPTDQLAKRFDALEGAAGTSWLKDPAHPLVVLAKLPMSVYVTTAYDHLLVRALEVLGNAEPVVLSSRWEPPTRRWRADHPSTKKVAEAHDGGTPVVLHLHGRHEDSDSMVLTELDHMEFNEQLIRDVGTNHLIDFTVKEKLAGDALLFIGFSYSDRNFRGLLRNLSVLIGNKRPTIAVQLPSAHAEPGRTDDARDYVKAYFGLLRGEGKQKAPVHVFWGSAREFMAYLRRDVG